MKTATQVVIFKNRYTNAVLFTATTPKEELSENEITETVRLFYEKIGTPTSSIKIYKNEQPNCILVEFLNPNIGVVTIDYQSNIFNMDFSLSNNGIKSLYRDLPVESRLAFSKSIPTDSVFTEKCVINWLEVHNPLLIFLEGQWEFADRWYEAFSLYKNRKLRYS